jgi:hypothetical protein
MQWIPILLVFWLTWWRLIYRTWVITPTITSTKIYWLSTTLGWLRLPLHSPRYTDYLPHSGDYAYHYIHQDILTIYHTRVITPTITSTKIYQLSTALRWLRLPLHPLRHIINIDCTIAVSLNAGSEHITRYNSKGIWTDTITPLIKKNNSQ